LEIRQMARDARGAGQVVVIAGVALGALQTSVRAGQGEAGSGVIKVRPRPRCGAVADRTIRWEPGSHVARIIGRLEIGHVARSASRIRAGQGVVPVNVTLTALQSVMRARQSEPRSRVIECGAVPTCGVVALLTGLREIGLHVARIVRVLEICQVARYAGC